MSKICCIVVPDDGRKLKFAIQGLIKSGACHRVLVQNYVHSYVAGEGKKLLKTQHKLVQIHFDESSRLISMLDKILSGWREDYWIVELATLE